MSLAVNEAENEVNELLLPLEVIGIIASFLTIGGPTLARLASTSMHVDPSDTVLETERRMQCQSSDSGLGYRLDGQNPIYITCRLFRRLVRKLRRYGAGWLLEQSEDDRTHHTLGLVWSSCL